MPNIKLKSNDDEVFDVDIEIAKASMTIKTMLEDLGMDENDDDPVSSRSYLHNPSNLKLIKLEIHVHKFSSVMKQENNPVAGEDFDFSEMEYWKYRHRYDSP